MTPDLTAALLVLVGTIVGAATGVVGTILSNRVAARNELRRVAVESAFREWERLATVAQERRGGGRVFPPAAFIYFNMELLRLADAGTLNAKTYSAMMARYDEFASALAAENERRSARRNAVRSEDEQ